MHVTLFSLAYNIFIGLQHVYHGGKKDAEISCFSLLSTEFGIHLIKQSVAVAVLQKGISE